jgi:hypothetical protein
MTNAQRNAIVSPAEGLLVYSTSTNTPWMYNGTSWENLADEVGHLNASPGDGLVYTNAFLPDINYFPGYPDFIVDTDQDSKVAVEVPFQDNVLSVTLAGEECLRIESWAYTDQCGTVLKTRNSNPTFSFYLGQDVGTQATISASGNTGVGYAALSSVVSNDDNTALGSFSLNLLDTGYRNTAIGDHAMDDADGAADDTAVGQGSLGNCTLCSRNVAVGYLALNSVTNSSENTGIGAGTDVGPNIDNSVAIGADAYVSDWDCLVLGSIDGVNGATQNTKVGIGTTAPEARLHIRVHSDESASTNLMVEDNINEFGRIHYRNTIAPGEWGVYGKPATSNANARLNFAYTNTVLSVHGDGDAVLAGSLTQNSDLRLKKNLVPVGSTLHNIVQLNGYTFRWSDPHRNQDLQTGVLAQEVEQFYPELVSEDEDGMKSVNYSALMPLLLESVKELSAWQEDQQKAIDENAVLIELLERELAHLERMSQR